MTIAIGFGYLSGIVLSYVCARWIVLRIAGRLTFRELRGSPIAILGIVCGIAALPPGLFLGTVVGGNLGGAYGGVVSALIGLGKSGVPIGLALGICVVTSAITSAGALLGAGIGKLLSNCSN